MPTLEQKIRKHCGLFEHIGDTEIHLEHILIAIEKSGKHVAIKENGHFVGQHVGTHIQSTGIDLSLPFSQWSPEVHEFINKLID